MFVKETCRIRQLQQSLQKCNIQLRSTEINMQALRSRNDKLENENRVINEQLKNIQLEFEQNSISNDYLQDLVNDVAEINVYDEVENVYCNELVQCAINLSVTNLKVATENVNTSY